MPCVEFLGIQLCVPSLDDIVGAILYPVVNLIHNAVTDLYDAISPLFQGVIDTLSPFFESVISGITGFISPILDAVQAALYTIYDIVVSIPEAIVSTFEGLASAFTDSVGSLYSLLSVAIGGVADTVLSGIGDITGTISGFISSAVDTIGAGIGSLGDSITQTVTGVGGALEGVFNTALEGIGGVVGGLFQGFGSLNINDVMEAVLGVLGQFMGAIGGLESFFSPIEPGEASTWVPGFVDQVTGACSTLHTSNMIVEGVSLGQIDVGLQDAWRYPPTAAAVALATELEGMNIREGLMPAYKRWILSKYVPNVPDFNSIISIYVKEGYLEDHWVELPPGMIDDFSELGYSEYWVNRLWGQHWQYPSPTQLYEMLHRTAGSFPEIGVTGSVLAEMLKLHDFEPKWRDPLAAISWNTWRIYDIRTGWEMGLLDNEELLARLIDTGYQPGDAEVLLEIQKMFVLRTEIDALTREADTDFQDGWISEEQLRENYAATPYNQNVQDLRISRALLRRDREWKKDYVAFLSDLFTKRRISEQALTEELSRIGVVESFISVMVERLKLKLKYVAPTVEEIPEATKPLTETRVLKLLKLAKIEEADALERLALLGYSPEDAKLILESETTE